MTKQEVEFKINQLDSLDLDIPVTVAGETTLAGGLVASGGISGLAEHATNAAAVAAGLAVGALYTTTGTVKAVTA